MRFYNPHPDMIPFSDASTEAKISKLSPQDKKRARELQQAIEDLSHPQMSGPDSDGRAVERFLRDKSQELRDLLDKAV